MVGKGEGVPYVSAVTVGRIADLGIKDAANMGAAMAPAAAQTLRDFLSDTGTNPQDYDLILTGDLGEVGSCLLYTSPRSAARCNGIVQAAVRGQMRPFIGDWPADNFVRWAHALGFLRYGYQGDAFELTERCV